MPDAINPKDMLAQVERKARLDLLEPAGNRAIAAALEFGAITKGYGVRNYVETPVRMRVYIAAIERHLDALKSGEDCAEDSGVSHVGHIGAGVHILEAAAEAGTLIDDRGPFPSAPAAAAPAGPAMACTCAVEDQHLGPHHASFCDNHTPF